MKKKMLVLIPVVLIALGAGGIKPCVSAFVGDQFGREQVALIDKVYSLFYMAINIGGFYGPAIRCLTAETKTEEFVAGKGLIVKRERVRRQKCSSTA